MVKTTVREALRDAMAEEMRRDDTVFVMGEEVAEYQGAYKVTQGLLDEFGAKRVIDTPITEHGFAGLGVGAAFGGLKPIVEFMTFNFAMQAMDHIVNSAAKTLYMSGGQMGAPMVFRGPNGAAARVGAQHSQDYAAWYSSIPGLKVVQPYSAADAKGLLKTAIRDPNPVIFLENEILYGRSFDVPKVDDLTIPFGKARIWREGTDVTIVSFGIGMTYALEAAEEAGQGRDRGGGDRPAHPASDRLRHDHRQRHEDQPLRDGRGRLPRLLHRQPPQRLHHDARLRLSRRAGPELHREGRADALRGQSREARADLGEGGSRGRARRDLPVRRGCACSARHMTRRGLPPRPADRRDGHRRADPRGAPVRRAWTNGARVAHQAAYEWIESGPPRSPAPSETCIPARAPGALRPDHARTRDLTRDTEGRAPTMPTEILMPALSPTMEDGTLAKWLVKEGDTVNAGDILAEIETDKATMEFEAVDEGVIGKILVAEGTEGVKVNAPIAVLLEEGESADDIGSALRPPQGRGPAEAPAAAPEAPRPPQPPPPPPPPRPPPPTGQPHLRLPARAAHRQGQGSRPRRHQGLRPPWPHREGRRGRREGAAGRRPRCRSAEGRNRDRRRQARHALRDERRAGPQDVRGPRDRGGQARRHAPHRRRPPDRGQADDPAFLPAPRHQARRADEVPLPAQQAAGRARREAFSVNDFIIKACANALQTVPAANAVWAGDRMLR
jgi:pyruvate/2-oxoglutarate/acetoin dehydrogenase E1 component/biotin carboxyl carrier protein